MTHPHRINVATPADLVKGVFWGFVQAAFAVGIPVLLFWFFFGHLLPGTDRPVVARGVEVRIDV